MAKTIIGIDAIGSWDSTEMFLEQWAEVFKNGILDKYADLQKIGFEPQILEEEE